MSFRTHKISPFGRSDREVANMSALYAETERGVALSHTWVLSGFLFFRYVIKGFGESYATPTWICNRKGTASVPFREIPGTSHEKLFLNPTRQHETRCHTRSIRHSSSDAFGIFRDRLGDILGTKISGRLARLPHFAIAEFS
uniref:Uncharacterized protein n=1 Tax=Candidatus Kentrum sp. TUN TaxID=2126343 RepID=A0A451AN83_9GAMM|nr:MAG: hypothetical protein BECKTUN1418E_GA0071001_11523 [Candidatus Kentron sp. TUN]